MNIGGPNFLNSTCYSLLSQPISAREKHYSPVWYIQVIIHQGTSFIAFVLLFHTFWSLSRQLAASILNIHRFFLHSWSMAKFWYQNHIQRLLNQPCQDIYRTPQNTTHFYDMKFKSPTFLRWKHWFVDTRKLQQRVTDRLKQFEFGKETHSNEWNIATCS